MNSDMKKEIRNIKVEQNDERNITLANAAKARAYELMMCLYAVVTVLLAVFQIISVLAFGILLTVFVVCQVYFVIRLARYQKGGM